MHIVHTGSQVFYFPFPSFRLSRLKNTAAIFLLLLVERICELLLFLMVAIVDTGAEGKSRLIRTPKGLARSPGMKVRKRKGENRGTEKRKVGRFAQNCSRVVGQKQRPCLPSSGFAWSVVRFFEIRQTQCTESRGNPSGSSTIRTLSSIFSSLRLLQNAHQYQALFYK